MSHTVARRRPSQPTRRRLARKQDLYRLPKEATHPRGEHPDPGSTCSPTQRHWQASASTSAARVPYGTRATVPNHHRGTKCHGDSSAASPARATHRSTTYDRLPEATAVGGRPLSRQTTQAPLLAVSGLQPPCVSYRSLGTAVRPLVPRIAPNGRGEFPLQSPPPERLRPR